MSIMKKALCIALCVICGILLTAADTLKHYPVLRFHYEVRKDLSVYFTNADEVIEKIRTALVQRHGDITISYRSQSDDLDDYAALVRELMGFALAETDLPYEGDYLDCTLGGYEVSCTRYGSGEYDYELVITPDYLTTALQEQETDELVKQTADELGLFENISDYAKIYRVYSYICTNVQYDTVHLKNDNYHYRSLCYGALKFKRATCQGYAHAVYRLMREAGIGCRIIKGMALNENGEYEYHAWNIVNLEGKWYALDATWDSGREEYEFFLKGSGDFARHSRDEEYLAIDFLNTCPMSEYSYERKEDKNEEK